MLDLSKLNFKIDKGLKPLSVFIFFIFFISLASASDLSFPYNKQYDIQRACFNNGNFCSSSFSCNLTYSYVIDGSLLVNNKIMTYQGSYYNYTITQGQNSKLGIFQGIMACGNGTDFGSDTFTVEITGDGGISKDFPIQIVFWIIGIAFIITGKIKEDLTIFKNIGAMIVMILGVLTLYPGYSGINYSNLLGLSLGVGSLGLGFFFMIEGALSRDREVPHYDQYDDGRYHE